MPTPAVTDNDIAHHFLGDEADSVPQVQPSILLDEIELATYLDSHFPGTVKIIPGPPGSNRRMFNWYPPEHFDPERAEEAINEFYASESNAFYRDYVAFRSRIMRVPAG